MEAISDISRKKQRNNEIECEKVKYGGCTVVYYYFQLEFLDISEFRLLFHVFFRYEENEVAYLPFHSLTFIILLL